MLREKAAGKGCKLAGVKVNLAWPRDKNNSRTGGPAREAVLSAPHVTLPPKPGPGLPAQRPFAQNRTRCRLSAPPRSCGFLCVDVVVQHRRTAPNRNATLGILATATRRLPRNPPRSAGTSTVTANCRTLNQSPCSKCLGDLCSWHWKIRPSLWGGASELHVRAFHAELGLEEAFIYRSSRVQGWATCHLHASRQPPPQLGSRPGGVSSRDTAPPASV